MDGTTDRTRKFHRLYKSFLNFLQDSLCIARASALAICLNTATVILSMCKVLLSGIRNVLTKVILCYCKIV